MANAEHYIGLMSGTSLDGVDAVLVDFSGDQCRIIGKSFLPFDQSMRDRLMAIQGAQPNELHLAALLGNDLARLYAKCVHKLMDAERLSAGAAIAIGCHGQTIRHRPETGYTIQLCNGALLAELTGTVVVCDFRSRDIAAGGQGAPLVPAFHHSVFAHSSVHRVVVNIGGIANITDLNGGKALGFDTGPGNMLMDSWAQLHLGKSYDKDGAWGRSGRCLDDLLQTMLAHKFFSSKPPKSTGRELFNSAWLNDHLSGNENPRDVQATLLALTAVSIAQAVNAYCKGAKELYVCGGGAANSALIECIARELPEMSIASTAILGIDPDRVEACAFAWLARQALLLRPGNLPPVTGAAGPRVLGAIYPA